MEFEVQLEPDRFLPERGGSGAKGQRDLPGAWRQYGDLLPVAKQVRRPGVLLSKPRED